eukprot:gene55990-74755_t
MKPGLVPGFFCFLHRSKSCLISVMPGFRHSFSGRGAIPHRRYSPRAPLATKGQQIRCNSGADGIVRMKENAQFACPKGRKETPMNQTNLLKGAAFMVLAGICFAAANAITFVITAQLGFRPQSDTFWQYAIATAFSLPFVLREGLGKLRTKRPILHIIRVILSALGVQAFVMSLASGTPIWQVIALVMTSPIFVLIGAKVFLGETVTPARWIAAVVGLGGASIV